MSLLPIIAVFLFGYAALVVARVAAAPKARSAARLAQIDAYGYDGAIAGMPAPERRSLVDAVGALLAGRMPRAEVATTRSRLLGAGMYDTSVERFLGYRALSFVLIPLLMAYVGLAGRLAPALLILFVGLGAFTGWAVPQAYLARRARLRLDKIDHAMPELVDLLVVGVESGVGFAGAMRLAAERIGGPLGSELALILREQSLGSTLSDALRHMLDRCETPATRSFVRTIVQGERLGVSIGQMLRSLADEMRKRRKARAEELANKAPIKILFPLVFLILPALFLVLLAPAAITLVKQFGGS